MSRAETRASNVAAILAAARTEIAEHGSGLSMRAVAREVGMVSSAIYRYFPTREALLTAMVVESYGNLAATLTKAAEGRRTRATRWTALGEALRAWALANPHEFQLIYGTPLPGYVAPPETVPAAAAVAAPFVAAGATQAVPGFGAPALRAQMDVLLDLADDVEPSGAAAVLTELGALIGAVSLELAGHLVGTADPADHLFAALLRRQVSTLGLR
ncbi:TetR/AcrR family transcriptional regulator [Nocardioides daejeonensis]|uniref:TetR/AcrR family transcriptional regulator n=1 Tax=Nocardioides daejeonensis TaxID=1046556 RepID=UPI000D749D1E|nr:TetR/AcrR family transcriptional regulator [Nocardioides daejeonensis]